MPSELSLTYRDQRELWGLPHLSSQAISLASSQLQYLSSTPVTLGVDCILSWARSSPGRFPSWNSLLWWSLRPSPFESALYHFQSAFLRSFASALAGRFSLLEDEGLQQLTRVLLSLIIRTNRYGLLALRDSLTSPCWVWFLRIMHSSLFVAQAVSIESQTLLRRIE